MLPCDLDKTREIAFHALPPGQAARARELLHGLDDIEANLGVDDKVLVVRYNVMHYTLDGLEAALVEQGFHLDNSLMQKLKRALARFCESVQRENVAINAPDVKSQKVFARVYEQQVHGDKDETPEEWRAYK
jgi:hypothetical protein